MKNYQAILFDLDGTLLHMPQDPFLKELFIAESTEVAPRLDVSPETLLSVIKKGVYAMVNNDGSCTNEEACLKVARPALPKSDEEVGKAFDLYYTGNFRALTHLQSPNPFAKKAVLMAREKAGRVILATNPVFPPSAQRARLSWIGLTPEDFDHVTHYENSHYCKPNPAYYSEILDRFHLDPKDCLMVGNDIGEDMIPAKALGMDLFLVTDCLIAEAHDPAAFQNGSFEELISFFEK